MSASPVTGDMLGEFIRRRDDILGGRWLSTDPATAARQLRGELGSNEARRWIAALADELSLR